MNKRTLVAYFSASGVTEEAAKKLAEAVGADIFKIRPTVPYSDADLDWNDKSSRSTREMNDSLSRPSISGTVENPQDYDTILIGFPVWWYSAPTIINTFLESADFSGKTIAPFCTSGGTGIEICERKLKETYGSKYVWKAGIRLTGNESKSELAAWAERL
ncbi:MAG: NAD(P)H-dependent oxidoreductase [Clostridia bacterium]|nr:NAD(P)H-dependent oxidoreductase [Clostridia bacterium]